MNRMGIFKGRLWLETTLGVALFVLFAYLSTFFFKRFDLTEERRHTLTETTIETVEALDDVVYVKVFLEGEFPADFQRLRQAIKEKLDEMRAYAGSNIQYEFINPSDAPDVKSREAMYSELVRKGLDYTALQIEEKDGLSEKIIFPGALISYKDKEIPVQILKNQQRATDAELVNRTINNLEYLFVNAIYQVQKSEKMRIAVLEGHGELKPLETKDIETELQKFYDVERLELAGMVDALSRNVAGQGQRQNRYDALIIAKPTLRFEEQDKYLIDQFIMNGGKVVWLIDPMAVDRDSLRDKDLTMATPLQTNLDDQLFTYGVRLNRDLMLDRTCAPISLLTGPRGNERSELFPWYFQPILIPQSAHPIVANVDPILTDFISSIDTVQAAGVSKRIILTTSPYTRILKSPARVSLNIVSINPDFGNSNRPNQPVGVLLEGKFNSVFKNRMSPQFLEQSLFDFRESSEFTRMLVVADGDIARNPVSEDGTKFRPLGFDPVLGRKIYGNKEFLINAVNYLLGDENLINVRSRSIKVRKLNAEMVISEGKAWQLMNIALPVLIVVVLGTIIWFIRKQRYAKIIIR